MPYVIFTANGEEYDRRELTRPLTLGRAPDCDISIPDITLSRHHCRLEPSENGRSWQLVDLHSKNGTHFLGQKIETHVFRDKDELRVGRTRLTFRSGAFVPSSKPKSRAVIRPTDPHEALSGTVTGMVVCEPGETETYEGMPIPQPRPIDPKSFEKDDVYGMINEIASSSWDSIQAQASQPTRMQRATPTPAMTTADRAAVRPKPRVSFALQAEPTQDGAPSAAPAAAATTQPAVQRAARPERPAAQPAPAVASADAEPPAAMLFTSTLANASAPTSAAASPASVSALPRGSTSSAEITAAIAAASKAAAASRRRRFTLSPKIASGWRAITRWRMPRGSFVPQHVLMAVATTAVVGLLFFGYVWLLLHMTRDTRPPASPSLPQSPAAMPDVPAADQSAALLLPHGQRKP